MTRRNLLIAAGAALLVVVLWYVLLWGPRTGDLSAAKDRREKAQALREELAARLTRLKAAQKDEPMKRARVEALRTTIPEDANLASFILDTNDAAAKAGIDFVSVAPSEPAPAVPLVSSAAVNTAAGAGAGSLPAEIGLQLQISGGYFQVLDFLNRIGEMPRLVITDGLTVNSDDSARLTVGMTARMFVRQVPPGYGDVPVADPAAAAPAAAAPSTPPPTATAAPAVPTSTTSGARS